MNKVYVIGRIVKDLELKTFGNENKSYLKFPLAINDYNSYTKEKVTNFIDVVAFGNKAEVIERFFSKGKQISVEGHLKSGSYLNQNNQKIYKTNIVLDNFDFIEKKNTM